VWGGSTSNCPAGACCARSADLLVASHDARGVPLAMESAQFPALAANSRCLVRGYVARRSATHRAAVASEQHVCCPRETRGARPLKQNVYRPVRGGLLATANTKKAASGSGFPRGDVLSSFRTGNRCFQPSMVTAGAPIAARLARGTLAGRVRSGAANRRSWCPAAEATGSSHCAETKCCITANACFGITGRRQGALLRGRLPSTCYLLFQGAAIVRYRAGASSSAAGGAASRSCRSPVRGNSITFMLPRPQST
jgi:hypothetical protein